MGYVCVVLLGVGVFYLPESPRRLLTLSGTDECINALRYIGGKQSDDSRAQAELRKLQAELKGRSLPLQRNLFGWLTGGAFYRLNLGIALQTFQQIIGANFFFYYGAFVFRSAGFTNLNPFVVQIVLGMVNVLCTLPGLYIIQNFGKRTPLIAGGLWQAAWMAVFAVVGRTGVDPDDKKASFALAFSACMFIAGYAMSWGPGVWIAG